ncbi:MAG TPA: hypothetical protein VFK42_04265 [Acidimicrobiales bacterium]|jgi:hypothetical protein|nr:hypothetical protein [Acidimicrobiales bacterium]
MSLAAPEYADRTTRLDLSGIDFGSFRDQPLDGDSLRCLRYMHDVESHTICYLRDVLATRAHKDPDITTFLTCWAWEEHWHGEAIGRVLRAHDEPAGRVRVERTRQRADGWRPAVFSAVSAVLPSFSAVHMTWGAVNEWTTQAGYAQLARRAGHPVLAELLRRIMRQEGRHIDVYASEARRRLRGSRAARRTTRLALSRFWSPVGAGVMPDGEVRFLVRHLFASDDTGRAIADRIDRRIDALPGLAGLDLVKGAVAASAAAA